MKNNIRAILICLLCLIGMFIYSISLVWLTTQLEYLLMEHFNRRYSDYLSLSSDRECLGIVALSIGFVLPIAIIWAREEQPYVFTLDEHLMRILDADDRPLSKSIATGYALVLTGGFIIIVTLAKLPQML